MIADEILDEARAGDDPGPVAAGALGVHVRTLPPALLRGREPQPDFILEHMRRRVDVHMHGPPQGDPDRRAVGGCRFVIVHDVFRFDWPKQDSLRARFQVKLAKQGAR